MQILELFGRSVGCAFWNLWIYESGGSGVLEARSVEGKGGLLVCLSTTDGLLSPWTKISCLSYFLLNQICSFGALSRSWRSLRCLWANESPELDLILTHGSI